MSVTRLLKHLLLALLLVGAQHAAAMHAFGHMLERGDDGAPVKALHAGCLGLHGIEDLPVPQFAVTVLPPEFSAAFPEARPADYVASHQNRYRSRAPPAIS